MLPGLEFSAASVKKSSYYNICICISNVYCSESTHDIRLTHYVISSSVTTIPTGV